MAPHEEIGAGPLKWVNKVRFEDRFLFKVAGRKHQRPGTGRISAAAGSLFQPPRRPR